MTDIEVVPTRASASDVLCRSLTQRAQVAEDNDERHEEIFGARKALRRAEAAF